MGEAEAEAPPLTPPVAVPPPVAIDDLATDLESYRLAKAEIEKWEAVADAAKVKIMDRVGDAEVATIDGHVVLKVPHRSPERFNAKQLRADLGDDALRAYLYRPAVPERRFEVQD